MIYILAEAYFRCKACKAVLDFQGMGQHAGLCPSLSAISDNPFEEIDKQTYDEEQAKTNPSNSISGFLRRSLSGSMNIYLLIY